MCLIRRGRNIRVLYMPLVDKPEEEPPDLLILGMTNKTRRTSINVVGRVDHQHTGISNTSSKSVTIIPILDFPSACPPIIRKVIRCDLGCLSITDILQNRCHNHQTRVNGSKVVKRVVLEVRRRRSVGQIAVAIRLVVVLLCTTR